MSAPDPDPDLPVAPAPLSVLLLLVAVGGALGALGRYALTGLGPARPVTLLINVVGSFALGLLVGLRPYGRWSRPFLGTGVLGGFTTFSALSLQVVTSSVVPATAYLVATLIGGVAAAALGLRLAA